MYEGGRQGGHWRGRASIAQVTASIAQVIASIAQVTTVSFPAVGDIWL